MKKLYSITLPYFLVYGSIWIQSEKNAIPMVMASSIMTENIKSISDSRAIESVTIFDEKNFTGKQITLIKGINSLVNFDNLTSSIKIPKGFQVVLYDQANVQGRKAIILKESSSDLDLYSFNNMTSSIEIFVESGITGVSSKNNGMVWVPEFFWFESQSNKYIRRMGGWTTPPNGKNIWREDNWSTTPDGKKVWKEGYWDYSPDGPKSNFPPPPPVLAPTVSSTPVTGGSSPPPVIIPPTVSTTLGSSGDWGGSENYPRIINRSQANHIVTNRPQLENALKIAERGQIIYVDDKAEIDMTGAKDLVIKSGVILASGRGRNGSLGALLYCTNVDDYNLFHIIDSNNIRITGLRFRGPDPNEHPPLTSNQKTILARANPPLNKEQIKALIGPLQHNPGCIRIGRGWNSDYEWGTINDIPSLNIEIDNNDMWAWPNYCVSVQGVSGITVRYNWIHNNLRDFNGLGAGYGVDVGRGHVLVEKNIFSYNRHDIACGGHPLSNYTFRNNLILQGGTHHSIDVHGWRESNGDKKRPDGKCYAGNNFIVEGNVVLQNFSDIQDIWAYNLLIRGIPVGAVEIRNNKFTQLKKNAVGQAPYGRASASSFINNVFDEVLSSDKRIIVTRDNQFGANYPNALFIAHGGVGYWTFRRFEKIPFITTIPNTQIKIPNMTVGDFDGDGADDLLYSTGQKWFISNRGKGDFQEVATANIRLSEFQVGDFDGDGKSDAMYTDRGFLYYMKSAKGPIVSLCASNDKFSDLRLGDFNGDGKTDVFRKKNGNWEVSYAGVSAWTSINSSAAYLSDLLFGDFNGDKKTDILWVHDGKWRVSWAGTTAWETINTAGMTISSLRVGDFDGDGKDDLFKEEGKDWSVSWGGRSQWKKINSSGYRLEDFLFGDFNGDKKTDVMVSFSDW